MGHRKDMKLKRKNKQRAIKKKTLVNLRIRETPGLWWATQSHHCQKQEIRLEMGLCRDLTSCHHILRTCSRRESLHQASWKYIFLKVRRSRRWPDLICRISSRILHILGEDCQQDLHYWPGLIFWSSEQKIQKSLRCLRGIFKDVENAKVQSLKGWLCSFWWRKVGE